jgi:hypothetical protein
MYIEDSKLYDLPVTFRVEAISRVWY